MAMRWDPLEVWGRNIITTQPSATGVAAVAPCPVGLGLGVGVGVDYAYGVALVYRLVSTIPRQSPRFGPGV
jgi:hypothetical protein